MVGETSPTGFVYRFQVRVQETGGAAATITQVAMVFFNGGTAFATVNRTENIPSSEVAANTATATNWTITDDIAGHPFATRVQITITFTDAVGTQSTAASADVPPLPVPPDPTPPTPTGFALSGTVRDQGAGALSGVLVSIKDTSRTSTTDGQGRYSFSGLSSGPLTLRVTHSGYDLLEQSITLTGDLTRDLSLQRTPTTPAPSIDSFSADSTNLTSGQNTTIRWSVSNATAVSIDNGIGNVSTSGSRQITPTFQVHTYRITATGPGGTRDRSISINVSGTNQCSAVGLPSNVTAICNNGQHSSSQTSQGTCSQNGGVRCWVCPGPLCR
jgi:hypothetical protein